MCPLRGCARPLGAASRSFASAAIFLAVGWTDGSVRLGFSRARDRASEGDVLGVGDGGGDAGTGCVWGLCSAMAGGRWGCWVQGGGRASTVSSGFLFMELRD